MKAAFLQDQWGLYFPGMRKARFMKSADTNIPKPIFIEALDALNGLLQERNEQLTFLCVGGGAMMLAYNARPQTHDLDGVLSPATAKTTALLHELAQVVATQFADEGKFPLDPGWINLEVKDIMHGQGFQKSNFQAMPQYQWSHLTLLFGKPGYLLAMKCQALRVGRQDFNDVVSLIRHLGIKTIAQLEESVGSFMDWGFIGNDEFVRLKLAIAWAFPGATEYEPIRQKALEQYRKVKGAK